MSSDPKSEIRNSRLVLIIDDDPDDVEITKRVLIRSGRDVTVQAAPSGEAALQSLRSGGDLPSLILIDLKMCGMSGIDTVRRIRADGRLKHIPLIIVTNSTLEADMRNAYDAGADSFIHKAFDIDEFGRRVREHLDSWLR